MIRPLALALLTLSAAPAHAAGGPCRDKAGHPVAGKTCAPAAVAPPARLEPYDPDRVRSGSRPGFIDLGGGTELRVGGRARYELDRR